VIPEKFQATAYSLVFFLVLRYLTLDLMVLSIDGSFFNGAQRYILHCNLVGIYIVREKRS
jgi:hypothetical protein